MSNISWFCGMTTVPSRILDGTFARTLTSILEAGFPKPRLFIDGTISKEVENVIGRLEFSVRNPPLRIYGNFHLGLGELFIRNPSSDYYAMFQDDFVTYKNLREYLERCEYPSKGYLNLYTFSQNERDIKGWYPSNQLGKGAVALVFNNAAVRALLTSNYWIERPASNPENKARLWKFIDGGIVETMRRAGYKEYVHNPSLVQHHGDKSTLGNMKHEKAKTFQGEDFDALEFLKTPSINPPPKNVSKDSRIGLVGYNVASGLGELNRQMAYHADIYRWLIKPHSRHKMQPLTEEVDYIVCPFGRKISQFLKAVDVVVFAETPYYKDLVSVCKSRGKRTVCVPMMEWMPPGAKGWPKEVDLFICPTKQCYDQFSHVIPCVYFPWPVDTERFKFVQRTKCERFLFINGHGGWKGRKGGETIKQLIKIWPEIPLAVRDQTSSEWGVEVLEKVEENKDLYSVGDVLISPHTVDGIGLEGMEAMACGMPVISTDGKPWNEIPAIGRIGASVSKRSVRRPVDWYQPDVEHLAEICKSLLGTDISKESLNCRKWAEKRSWENRVGIFNDLVRFGTPKY